MGMFRTVHAVLSCDRCSARFTSQVQFKTGGDYLEKYAEGDAAPDLDAGSRYLGITDALCARCADARRKDGIRALRDAILDLAVARTISLSVGGSLVDDDRARRAVEAAFAPMISTARGRRIGDFVLVPGDPSIPSEVHILRDGITLWPLPAGANPWTAYDDPFWRDLAARVERRQSDAGWKSTDDVDVVVEIGDGQQISVHRESDRHPLPRD